MAIKIKSDHDHSQENEKDGFVLGSSSDYKMKFLKNLWPSLTSFTFLVLGLLADHIFKLEFFKGNIRFVWYLLAYLPVAVPVIKEAYLGLLSRSFFTEFTLMFLATLGAFALGEYPEAVAVMLFYAIGEQFQLGAINRAKSNIKALLDVRPSSASVLKDNAYIEMKPELVNIGDTVQVKNGESVPLDGILLNETGSFNTIALTGESAPRSSLKGEAVFAGMINLGKVIEIKVTKIFSDSSISRILELVQNATAKKAKTELLIRRLAKIYTPIVFFAAISLVIFPWLFDNNFDFNIWLYRALVFLVISCPCALVISIPLGYFGGIGAASRHGILFKGSNYLDTMTKVNMIVMDKTGTLTAGVFKVQKIESVHFKEEQFVEIVSALESKSTHPIAIAITQHIKGTNSFSANNVEEISGHGLKGQVNEYAVLAGNTKLLKKFSISYPKEVDKIIESIVVVAIDGAYAGYISVADQIKPDAQQAVKKMHDLGLKTMMLSGDKKSITEKVAQQVGVDFAFGDLLPEDKVRELEKLKKDKSNIIVFVGDGINDAPVLALSDVGIAMGGLGSDAAIETANVIIQNDQPSKIITAIHIAKVTRRIVLQNITLAFTVKIVVLILGAGGLATMWEAVFADVGVAFLAILNAIRIQKMKF